MKKLYIVRHSKAVEMAPDFSDFNRCLADYGRQKAVSIARHLAQDLDQVDLILSSPACRALETARIFAEHLNYSSDDIVLQQALYHFGGIENALDIIAHVDDDVQTLMLFGHNPTFNALSWHLCKDFREGMPTASVVGINFKTSTWTKAIKKGGSLQTYLTKRNLD
ncbi:MAG: histidine phosphatase family protein [Candidatus Marinimicrobia bacterium]|nr:histidine phosphatase family protein [Candidatus Neomarinimicrobiota bacterium]MCF7922924.1 histidine phosphatase family protein [Candidatus Neomarinimicrobiota bacterium]